MRDARREGVDRLLAARIAGQAGLLTRAQAHGGGFTDDAIAWRVASGRWLAVHPGVYLTMPGRDDWEMRAVAALLCVGAPAALCGPSAGHAWGLVSEPTGGVTVVVPAGRRGTSRPGIEVTRSRHMLERVHPSAWPHRVTAEHAVLDLAGGRPMDRIVGLVARACQKGLVSTQSLAAALDSRPGQAHRRLLLEGLTGVGLGVESPAEWRYVHDVERAHGLPEARRQDPGTGSTRRDNAYDEVRLIVEVDGRLGHEGWVGRQRDGRRDRASAREGWLTVRVFWPDVALTPCELAAELVDILRARGWRGIPRPCRRPGCALVRGIVV
ncbi:MAG TPA: hypothetical protein VFJ94_05320 [Intrasporangium sp.]|uniref:hypothetical protein n=1 Tax=Intrasporangium sp. TaxID=1925024 RepID=UPI002D782E48|nr:hypothetical protein [Intrasporangium sp.]HET7397924.1 hypothetical protein [Intrasporangium sp.]